MALPSVGANVAALTPGRTAVRLGSIIGRHCPIAGYERFTVAWQEGSTQVLAERDFMVVDDRKVTLESDGLAFSAALLATLAKTQPEEAAQAISDAAVCCLTHARKIAGLST